MKKVSIKQGAILHMDFAAWKWPDIPYYKELDPFMLFECKELSKDRYHLRAFGFGITGSKEEHAYGNGSLFVDKKDIIDWSKM